MKTETKNPTAVGQTCPNCGMKKEDWSEPKGYSMDGEVYCCQGCADGTGCTCV
jgi:hypothetical protein